MDTNGDGFFSKSEAKELYITSMGEHLKYFGVTDEDINVRVEQ